MKLAGFDGDEYAGLVGLTTAVFDSEALAEAAFSAMTGLLSKDPNQRIVATIPIMLRAGRTS